MKHMINFWLRAKVILTNFGIPEEYCQRQQLRRCDDFRVKIIYTVVVVSLFVIYFIDIYNYYYFCVCKANSMEI